jgi:replication factor C small subunit
MDWSLPWVEKYRPKRLEDVVGQKHVIERLKKFAEIGDMPNLLFAGPAGTGKTTCALALAREILKDTFDENFLELNASDERGINVVREQIKDFAKSAPVGGAKFRIIFLDEADALTADAQQALRRTMENFAKTCRFIFSCNYSSRIIDPLQSRCAFFRFKPLSDEEIKERLKYIAENENLEVSEDGFDALVYVCEGDLRRAINYLQACAAISKKIDAETVYTVAARASPKEIHEIFEVLKKGDFELAKSKILTMLIKYGMSGEDIIKQFNKEVWKIDISDDKKAKILESIAEVHYRLVIGSSEKIQLDYLLAKIMMILKE